MVDIVISGASGLIGSALKDSLRADGDRPITLVRRPPDPGADEIRWDPDAGTIDSASLEGCDAVVHLAGAGIGDKRWSDARKNTIRNSRADGTSLLAGALASLENKPTALISSSGIGFYGSQGDRRLTEADPVGAGFLADVCAIWEASTAAAADAGIRTVIVRTAAVLTPNGGILARQLPLFKVGLGGRFGPGTQWLSWISLRDHVRAVRFLIDSTISGPVNLCSPNPVTNLEFTKTLGAVLRRPTVVPVPLVGPKVLFGSEFVEQLILASQRGVPSVLESRGFTFEDPNLDEALRFMLSA